MSLISIHLFCLLLISSVASYKVTDKIDFEKDCNVQMYVRDSSIVEIFAYPLAGVLPEIASCQLRLVATPKDRKLVVYFHEFFLGPGACGHKLKIYDGDRFQNDPARELTCSSPLNPFNSKTNEVIISFTKPSVDSSQLYKFNIKVTTDREEPYLLFVPFKKPGYRILQHRNRRESENIPGNTEALTGDAGGSGGGLTSGAIAGIAVGCVVGAVIIIAICIYALWKFMRQAEEKKRYGANEPPPVFVTSSSSTVNGILKHPGSAGSTRSKSTKGRGFDNDAFSDTSETKNSRYSETPLGDKNDNRYDEEMGRGSYSRRGRDRQRYDEGHQNPSYMDDDYSERRNRYGDKSPRTRQSYKEANEERQHISLADLAEGQYADRALRTRRYGDESSRTESSFQTDTSNRTYSDSQDSRDDSVSYNPTGRYSKNREGSIRRSRSRSKSMTSSHSGQTRRGPQRSSSADRAEQTSQQGSQHGSQQRQHHHHHHHHRGSSGSSRRKKQKPPEPYLPIFAETKKSKKKH